MSIITADIYDFFLVADIAKIVKNEWLELILEKVCRGHNQWGSITHDKRLRTVAKNSRSFDCSINTEKYILLDGVYYRIHLNIYDNCALQGNISYAYLLSNVSLSTKKKEILTKKDKKHMILTLNENPEDFIEYSGGDLENHTAAVETDKMFELLHKELGLKGYYGMAKQTVGSSVFKLFQDCLKQWFCFDSSADFYMHVKEMSHEQLMKNQNETIIYLAKTNGGRCYNNRPLEPSIKGILVDINITGCYGSGLSLQRYPIGKPMILSYNLNTSKNKYHSLREFLKLYGDELVRLKILNSIKIIL
uniref:Uncharacterized protein n=1 Tax=Palisada sp. TaxID=1955416 RepID=A0A1Z1MSD4_9FLOR|nr:hypothetical protein [Palisada sp.]